MKKCEVCGNELYPKKEGLNIPKVYIPNGAHITKQNVLP